MRTTIQSFDWRTIMLARKLRLKVIPYEPHDSTGPYVQFGSAAGLDIAGRLRRAQRGGAHQAGKVLPTLRDGATDRATRAGYVPVPPGGVIVISGDLLLGAGLDVEMTVHLQMSGLILARHTASELA